MMLWVLSPLLLLFGSVDVWYFLRGAWAVLGSLLQDPVRDVLAEQAVRCRVLPHDIDYMGHMNNSRYLRECDFSRLSHYARSGLALAAFRLRARMVVGALSARYRRSLALGEVFELRSRIVAWDDRSFFLEQRFVSARDGFVSAVVLSRQNVLSGSPDQIIQHALKRKVECPAIPEDLQHWINYNSASSQALRAESGLDEKTK